jgi:hypothetical protein
MQPWEIKALELEASALKHLDGFIHEHALACFVGLIYLLMVFGISLIWLLSTGSKGKGHIRPVIFIDLSAPPPPPPDTFDPFPPLRECDCDHDDWLD